MSRNVYAPLLRCNSEFDLNINILIKIVINSYEFDAIGYSDFQT